MKKLLQGIVDFREKVQPAYRETFARLALGQSPDALLIACSDSRVVPNLFASSDPGDMFVVRNVGNLIPPCGEDGISIFDKSEAAAVEFAVEQLKVKDIIVCGHSECGAHMAVLRGTQGLSGNLRSWLRHAEPSLYKMHSGPHFECRHLAPHNQLSQLNVLQQLEHLRTYPSVRQAMDQGTLQLHGWWFDIANAEVLAWEPTLNRFASIDRELAQVILQRLDH
ncbi:MAG TPA: carbonic anhydrase [Oligoflexus sp.]|uniref:carbonic anhydrase n=1 Tax=Oligoflexus sp. TaxID=1971216 RepID=UPI002D80860C|nr:carbonic anhydrase [Oligoflexus sp.]HET9238639.1 carbonic anhydrase [Oligoflexus sp.]